MNSPQQSFDHQKRLMIALLLSAAVIVVWQSMITPPPRPAPQVSEASGEAASDGSATAGEPSEMRAAPEDDEASAEEEAEAAPDPMDGVEVLPPQRLASDNVIVDVTNVGARVSRFEIVEPEKYIPREGFLGPFPSPDQERFPFAIQLGGVDALDEDSVFAFVEEESTRSGEAWSELVYRWISPDGAVQVDKRFRPDEHAFGFDMDVVVTNLTSAPLRVDHVEAAVYGRWREEGGGIFDPSSSTTDGICVVDHEDERETGRKLDVGEPERFDGEVSFAGIDERYFLSAVAPRELDGSARFGTACVIERVPNTKLVRSALVDAGFEVIPGEEGAVARSYTLYAGPKDLNYLRNYPHSFDRSVDFGWWGFLARPIRWLLVFFNGWAGNMGIAIILLTIVLKLMLMPISHKAYKNMEKMREVQPRLKELQEKYANDRTKLAEEQMKLFKETGTNPFGCLPMLLQMPIYIALYRTIWGSAELYKAEFALWLNDLSQADPTYVLPVSMGIFMFVQQRMMPQTVDNPQAKVMMTIMPIMFTGMMLFLPSGLVLYILANMVLSIAQQFYIRRTSDSAKKDAKAKGGKRKKGAKKK